MLNSYYENDPMVSFLERIKGDLNFNHWYFGHYHVDVDVNEQFTALYDRVIPIQGEVLKR